MLRTGMAETVAYRGELLVWILSTNTPIIMLFLWRAVAADGPLGRYGTTELTAYFLVTLAVRLLTGSWVAWIMNTEIRQGDMGMRLLKPVHPFVHYLSEHWGAWPVRAVFVLPVFAVIAVVVGVEPLTHDPRQWLLLPLAVLGAFGVTFSAMLCIGSLSFFWQSTLALIEVWYGLYVVFSGYIVPIELFPAAVSRVLLALPFPYLLSFPVELTLGLHDFATSLVRLGVQWAYVVGFTALALVLWRAGVRRYEAFGG